MPRTRDVGRGTESPVPSLGAAPPPSTTTCSLTWKLIKPHARVFIELNFQPHLPSSLRLVEGAGSSDSVIAQEQPHPEAILALLVSPPWHKLRCDPNGSLMHKKALQLLRKFQGF